MEKENIAEETFEKITAKNVSKSIKVTKHRSKNLPSPSQNKKQRKHTRHIIVKG